MKRMLPMLAAILTVAAVLVLGVGMLLPARWQVTRSVMIEGSPEAIFPLVNDLSQWRHWTVWNRLNYEHLNFETNGTSNGAGAEQIWEDEELGEMQVKLVESQAPRQVAYTQQFEGSGKTITGQISLEPQEAGTLVTWTQSGALGNSPLARWTGILFLDSMVGADATRGLVQLKERVELGE